MNVQNCRSCGAPITRNSDDDRGDFEAAWDDQPDQPASYRNSHEEKGMAWAWYSRGRGDEFRSLCPLYGELRANEDTIADLRARLAEAQQ